MKGIYEWNGLKVALLASTRDQAAMTISEILEKEKSMLTYKIENKSSVFCTIDDLPKADLYICLSKHSSITKKPTYTVHSVGNFNYTVKVGGQPLTLGLSHAFTQSVLLNFLNDFCQNNQKYDDSISNFEVIAEATHHGPLIPKPIIFIEMGSDETVWLNRNAGRVIADVIQHFFQNSYDETYRTLPVAIGFGGGHYPRKFSSQILKKKYLIGHMCPKYALSSLTDELIEQMIQKTIPLPTIALFDKKGTKRKQFIREIVEKKGLRVEQV